MKKRHLRKLITYDKETGIVNTECTVTLQSVGYMQINIEGKNYKLHNMLYILVHGKLPSIGTVFYINGNRLDNRAVNLGIKYSKKQKAEKVEQSLNSRGLSKEESEAFTRL